MKYDRHGLYLSRTELRAWSTEHPIGNLEFSGTCKHDVGSVIGAGASLIGSAMSSDAASSAADTQAAAAQSASQAQLQAAKESIAEQKRQYDLNRSDLAPWRTAGGGAINKLSYLLGIGGSNSGSSAPTVESRDAIYSRMAPQYAVNGSGAGSGTGTGSAGSTSGTSATAPYNPGSALQFWGGAPLNGGRAMVDAFGNEFVYPGSNQGNTATTYDIAGLNAAVDAEYARQQQAQKDWQTAQGDPSTDPQYGSLLKNFSLSDFQADPGYQFRVQQGEQGINRALSSRGMFDSGAALKELDRFNSGIASDEFGAAYNRDATNKNRVANFLQSVAGLGQSAANTTASLGSSTAANIGNTLTSGAAASGNYLTSGANALAAGQVGSANALSSGLSGAWNNYQSSQLLNRLSNGGSSYNFADPAAAPQWGGSYSGFNNPSNYG